MRGQVPHSGYQHLRRGKRIQTWRPKNIGKIALFSLREALYLFRLLRTGTGWRGRKLLCPPCWDFIIDCSIPREILLLFYIWPLLLSKKPAQLGTSQYLPPLSVFIYLGRGQVSCGWCKNVWCRNLVGLTLLSMASSEAWRCPWERLGFGSRQSWFIKTRSLTSCAIFMKRLSVLEFQFSHL